MRAVLNGSERGGAALGLPGGVTTVQRKLKGAPLERKEKKPSASQQNDAERGRKLRKLGRDR